MEKIKTSTKLSEIENRKTVSNETKTLQWESQLQWDSQNLKMVFEMITQVNVEAD